MARNCEKKLIGLNRLWLEKQRKEELEKRPKRPHLSSLNSAAEVKKWIPGIKKEIDYCLDTLHEKRVKFSVAENALQISGARQHRYPDTKMKEFEKKVEELEKEYKRFVKKVYELDPSTTGVPWQPRGYTSKRKNVEIVSTETIPKKICTPLLEEEHLGRPFSALAKSSESSGDVTEGSNSLVPSDRDKGADLKSGSDKMEIPSQRTDPKSSNPLNNVKSVQPKSLLGLDYDSSSDSDVS